MKECVVCGAVLTGSQRRFCSNACKQKDKFRRAAADTAARETELSSRVRELTAENAKLKTRVKALTTRVRNLTA